MISFSEQVPQPDSPAALRYVLLANPMRGNTEEVRVVAHSSDLVELETWANSQRCEPYITESSNSFSGRPDHKYRMYHIEGPLQWFNDGWVIITLAAALDWKRIA